MKEHNHRQLGVKLGKCANCGRPVWSKQASLIVQAKPLMLAHARC